MQNGTHDNAMTEIALALAMGFFSILVLTMVSMGAGDGRSDAAAAVMALAANTPGTAAQAAPDDFIVVYHQQRYFTAAMAPIDPKSIDTPKRIVLALARDLPLSEAMAARAQFATTNLVVSTLDERWQAALQQKTAAAGVQP